MSSTAEFRLGRDDARVFVGLMIGMFVAAISQTIVGPAMPRIIAELGGMEHYSWVATTAARVGDHHPIVGSCPTLGRRRFYLGGLLFFMAGSVVSGVAHVRRPDPWQGDPGHGDGHAMPLSVSST